MGLQNGEPDAYEEPGGSPIIGDRPLAFLLLHSL